MVDGWAKDSYHYYNHFPEVVEGGRAKVALDVGCGVGADLLRFAQEGIEVVGIDLTETVDVAYRNTSHVPTIHIVQANLHRLPFRPATFQVVYSFGVLHHLPNPKGGFGCLVEMALPGGWVLIYVYEDFSNRTALEQGLLNTVGAVRRVTRRLPPQLLHALCIAGLPLIYLSCSLPYQLLKRIHATRSLADRIPYRHTANPATLVSDLYDRFAAPIEKRYSLGELEGWFRSAGFSGAKNINYRGWVVWGVKSQEEVS
ncbi:class I SAM-dependent methyltransferase [Nitrospinae bacterium AH_259_B05_G02_I21]|nr:class I SAM-dependent methyltransferase [Nitrospinae bacterium AH_259_B05_G02_I21]MDA2931640.1 class I SAM-dependent methyltransferase [Nitrospinae bacterium AH-259-F20]